MAGTKTGTKIVTRRVLRHYSGTTRPLLGNALDATVVTLAIAFSV